MVFGSAFGPSPLEAPRDDNQSTVLNIWFENMLVGFLHGWMFSNFYFIAILSFP